jgi:hypothetical protein
VYFYETYYDVPLEVITSACLLNPVISDTNMVAPITVGIALIIITTYGLQLLYGNRSPKICLICAVLKEDMETLQNIMA